MNRFLEIVSSKFLALYSMHSRALWKKTKFRRFAYIILRLLHATLNPETFCSTWFKMCTFCAQKSIKRKCFNCARKPTLFNTDRNLAVSMNFYNLKTPPNILSLLRILMSILKRFVENIFAYIHGRKLTFWSTKVTRADRSRVTIYYMSEYTFETFNCLIAERLIDMLMKRNCFKIVRKKCFIFFTYNHMVRLT